MVDFNSTFAATATTPAIRVVLSAANQKGHHVVHLDVPGAYLHSKLDKPLYMKEPEGSGGKFMQLHKGIYGLRQAGALWQKLGQKQLKNNGYVELLLMPGLYKGNGVVFSMSVEDFLVAVESETALERLLGALAIFKTKNLGDVEFFLGAGIKRDGNRKTWISQESYADRFGMVWNGELFYG
jgi:hypothetical protein